MSSALTRLAHRIARLESDLAASRTPQLGLSSIDSGSLDVTDPDTGTPAVQIGQQFDGTFAITPVVGPTPPTPSAPNVAGVSGGLVIGWGGTYADATTGVEDPQIVAPMDWARVDLVAGPVGFDPLGTPPQQAILSPRGGEVFLALEPGEYEVYLITRSVVGKPSIPSVPTAGNAIPVAVPDPSDGLPPASSPTPEALAGLGSVFLRWPAVANDDPVIYDVYGSVTSGFTKDASTLIASTPATLATIRSLANGTPLAYGTPYYFAIVARDADGSAAAGAEATATPRQASGPDIAADFAYLGQVAANQINSGNLSAALALIGSLTVGGATGARLELNPNAGFTLFSSDGTPRVAFPLDGSGNVFDGDIIARGLTTMGRASFRGVDNEISRNSAFVLATGTTAPSNAPVVNAFSAYNINPMLATQSTTRTADSTTLGSDAANWVRLMAAPTADGSKVARVVRNAVNGFGGWATQMRLEVLDRAAGTTTMSPLLTLPTGTVGISGGAIFSDLTEVMAYRVGSEWWLLGSFRNGSTSAYEYRVVRYDATTWAKLGDWLWAPGSGEANAPSGCTDGTNFYIGSSIAGTVKIRRYSNTGAALETITSSQLAPTDTAYNFFMAPVAGNFDYGSKRFLVGQVAAFGGGNGVHSLDAAGVAQTAEKLWDGDLYSVRSLGYWGGKLQKIESWEVGTATATSASLVTFPLPSRTTGLTWYVQSTWYDSDTGGTGTHETTPSPMTAVTKRAREALVITTAAPADAGDPDSPDSSRLYVGTDAGNLRLVGVYTPSSGPFVLWDFTGTGATAPTLNTFPDGVAGQIMSRLGGFTVKGDGTGAWPYVENNLKSTMDTKDSAILTSAQTYADTKKSEAITSANSYADTKKSEAITSANGYTDSAVSSLPRGIIGFGEQTADSAGANSTTQVDIGLTATFTVPAGRRVKVSILGAVKSTAASDRASIILRKDAGGAATPDYLMIAQTVPMPAANSSIGVNNAVIVTPAAGTYTYRVWLQRVTGTGTVTLAGAATRTQLVIEDCGAA